MSVDQLKQAQSKRGPEGATLREEIASLSNGSPLNFREYLTMTRYEMWLIYLGGG
jgi:hypothetical protein